MDGWVTEADGGDGGFGGCAALPSAHAGGLPIDPPDPPSVSWRAAGRQDKGAGQHVETAAGAAAASWRRRNRSAASSGRSPVPTPRQPLKRACGAASKLAQLQNCRPAIRRSPQPADRLRRTRPASCVNLPSSFRAAARNVTLIAPPPQTAATVTAAGRAITKAQIDQVCTRLRSDTAPQPAVHIGGYRLSSGAQRKLQRATRGRWPFAPDRLPNICFLNLHWPPG